MPAAQRNADQQAGEMAFIRNQSPWRIRFMIKKMVLALLFAVTFVPVASFAQVQIRIGPPVRVYERPGPPPERGMVWTQGYHRYEGDHYVWTPGQYQRPPREHARWVAHRWVHQHGQWVMVEGHWR